MEQSGSCYKRYANNLVSTPLFQGLSADEIEAFLEALRPSIRMGRANPSEGPIRKFQVIAACNPPQIALQRLFPYSGVGFGMVGMLMGEIPALSLKDDYLKRTPLKYKKDYPPLDWEIECLDFSPDDLCKPYGAEIADIQRKVLRNLLGILAQKVIDVRRELYLSEFGWDMYARENMKDVAKSLC